jgi:hypothetical protein
MIIEKQKNGGIRIKDDVTGASCVYYFCNLKEAERYHRKNNGLRYKHFIKIYL